MNIKELNLKNFGKFSEKNFYFSDGLNIIYGANGSGKTTIYQSIAALLFGMEKQRGRAARNDAYTTYQPWENRTWYEGTLKFETGGKLFRIERNFYHTEKSTLLFCETDGEELSVEQGDLDMLLGEIGAELYFNTAAVGQLKMKPQDIIYSYLKNHIAGIQEAGSQGTDVVKALQILDSRKKAIEQQKKKQTAEIQKRLEKLDAGLELLEKEMKNCLEQLELLKRQKLQMEEVVSKTSKGVFARFLSWLKGLFCRKRRQKKAQARREELLKLEEKIKFSQELLVEKESQKEELLFEKESFYEKLHEQSKDMEITAIEFAKNRIMEISAIRKEEVFEKLLEKTSGILKEITKGEYQKLILEENEEPVVWDGNRTVKLFQLSAGTVDQVYLALRIGLQDLFFEDETLPLLFDDAFVYFDDKRLERLLMYLNGLGRQVLLFSCHKRELRILEKHQIPYAKILL